MSVLIVLGIYTVACFLVLRASLQAGISSGSVASVAAMVANGLGILAAGYLRPVLALPILVVAALAAANAFRAADEYPRDSDEDQRASRAGMALVGLVVAETFIVLIGGFVWAIDH